MSKIKVDHIRTDDILDSLDYDKFQYDCIQEACESDVFVRPSTGGAVALENLIIDEIYRDVPRKYFKSFTDIRRGIMMELTVMPKYRFLARTDYEAAELKTICSRYELLLRAYIDELFNLNTKENMNDVNYDEVSRKEQIPKTSFMQEICDEIRAYDFDKSKIVHANPNVKELVEQNDKYGGIIFDFSMANYGVEFQAKQKENQLTESDLKLVNRLIKFETIVGTNLSEVGQEKKCLNDKVDRVEELEIESGDCQSFEDVMKPVLSVLTNKWETLLDDSMIYENVNFEGINKKKKKKLERQFLHEVKRKRKQSFDSLNQNGALVQFRKFLDESLNEAEFTRLVDIFYSWYDDIIDIDDLVGQLKRSNQVICCQIVAFHEVVMFKKLPKSELNNVVHVRQSSGSQIYVDVDTDEEIRLDNIGPILVLAIFNPSDRTEIKIQKSRCKFKFKT